MRTAWRWPGPTGLAVFLTVLNAAKPAAVDDTAYLQFAAQIAAHPLDPYGGTLFWYAYPQPAHQILLPPVLPYWLAAGTALVGDHLFLLKLLLFPFSLLLAHAAAWLLRRFAPGVDRPLTAMTVLGPAVLPMYGAMLDVPAVALGLAAVAAFVRGCDGGRVGWVLAAGLAAGLAAQTKYTMLPLPVVFGWYGLLSRRFVSTAVAVGLAAAVFVGWEAAVARKYGDGHFLYHLRDQQEWTARKLAARFENPTWRDEIAFRAGEKWELFQPMLGHLGWLGVGAGLAAGLAVGVPRVGQVAGCWILSAGAATVCLAGQRMSVLWYHSRSGKPLMELPQAVFVTSGAICGLAVLATVVRQLVRWRRRRPVRWDRDGWFLVGWLVVELAGYFALTPFPAARRVVGLAVVGSLVAGRLLARAVRSRPARRRRMSLVAGYTVAAGLTLYALDTWDAVPERSAAGWAAGVVGDPAGGTVWYNGHWGFQYYCERHGMRPVVPGVSELRPGDFLVFPAVPDDTGFYRPYHGGAKLELNPDRLEFLSERAWDDPLMYQTIPNLYGGDVPVRGRWAPRLKVVVYRVTRQWVPGYAF